MAHCSFVLQNPKSEKPTTIYCFLTVSKGKRFKLNTRERVLPQKWNPKKQNVRPSMTGSVELNHKLKLIGSKVLSIVREAEIHALHVDKAYVETQLWHEGKPPQQQTEFWDHIDIYLKAAEPIRSEGVIEVYRASINKLKAFEKKKRIKLSFASFDKSFYDQFVGYLIKELGFTNNTVGKHIKTLKAFLNDAAIRGYNDYTAYKRYKVFREDTLQVALSQEELNALAGVDLNPFPPIKNARDLFLIQCYTGLRFSDLANVRAENMSGNTLALITRKTKQTLLIPLSPDSKVLIRSLVDGHLHLITNQKMNDYIKQAAQMADIDRLVILSSYSGNRRIDTPYPKYELISSHTGRRTFITLCLQKGMRREIVMRITGHKDLRSFEKYIKITDDTLEREFLNVWG